MNFALTEEQKILQEMAKNFAENEIKPHVEEDEKNQYWRKGIFDKMAELGFFGFCIDEKYGGNGMGFLEGVLVIEQIAKVHTSWRMAFNMQCWGPSLTIQKFGTEEQKQHYIPKFVSGEYVGSFAMTETDVGSDVAGMKCLAEDKGDYYLLNGNKMWITNGTVSDHGLLYVKTNKDAGAKGITCFIMDYSLPGITRKKLHEKVGLLASDTAEITFEDVKVPKKLVLGEVNKGFQICMTQLNATRLGCSAGALGLSGAILEASIKYANERAQFGQPIGKYQLIQQQIAEMKMGHEALSFLVYKAAWLKDRGLPNVMETSMSKLYGAKEVVHAANECMKLFGSFGYSEEYPCGRFLRDSKQFETLEGTSNMHTMIVANAALGFAPNRA
ncbi:MAG TPA: acyl-CoA dehydrogenase family protein [Smithellaceae bacterium]|jgi:glutaryl-CoA dehydrogenase (non-decarboxylating)|nr:acyl-CoA dehydrogenase family protein [Smithellaceae bacterium]HNT90556.1 acyl-CoA dehydrogenase family protein [Smithellaceae bacterium]HNV64071.1 acyl-CoA dehydrogenase family protein [Smithellaceae bacterium]HNZ30563.1 acyl-CoA dehydrogenase family protein [Smithellaceae bacterium]HOD30401.1 acyl-CoA dehydrogenase family protein [Smithellaceae bacterium]